MNITRHISIDEEHVEKIKPYVEKHNGNLGAAIKEIINQAGRYNLHTNSSSVDISLFNWMLKEIDDILVPDYVLDDLIDPGLINSIEKLEGYLKRRFSDLKWDVNLDLKYDNNIFPSDLLIEINGPPQKIKFVACLLSQYLVKNSLEYAPLGIRSVVKLNECIKVELSRSSKKEAQNSLNIFFGRMDEVVKTIKSRPAFWKAVVNAYLLSNYNMVTVHRNYFEDLLANNIPLGETTIETMAKKPLQEIPHKEMLSLIKDVYETSGIVNRVDIDKDSLVLFHNYRTKEAIEKIKKSLIALLEASGHLYDAKSTANMIVMTHRPDVGIKINEIVTHLKTSNSRMDQELIIFMAFLEGLKDISDIPLVMAVLGRRIGRSLMEEYESENEVKSWNLGIFQKALEVIDSRLHRVSEWKLEGSVLQYTIKKCNIATEGNRFDAYVCRTAREAFKGALDYAFGNKAELDIKKLLSNGDNFCEVVIRTQ